MDGQTVHVILHLSHGYVSWIERFRIDRLRDGHSLSSVEMVVPEPIDLRFVRDRAAVPRAKPDGFPRLLTIPERETYGRFADALRIEDVAAFEAQIAIATVLRQDPSHTNFGNTNRAPTIDADMYDYLDAFYDDIDDASVNVILHFVDGAVAWMERFRLDGALVQTVVPASENVRFVMIKG